MRVQGELTVVEARLGTASGEYMNLGVRERAASTRNSTGHGVEVQVRVVADGEEQVVSQTNVEMMRCSSVPSWVRAGDVEQDVKDAERLWNPVKTRKRRRGALRGGSVHMNVSSRATIATWSSRMLKAPRIPCGANPARDVPPAARPMPARPPGGMLYAYRYEYMRMQISPSICVVCRSHPQSAW